MTMISPLPGRAAGRLCIAGLLLLLLPLAGSASPGDVLRVMTLNVAHARAEGDSQILQSVDQARLNLWRVANVLKRESPHVAAFQEIDRNSIWNGRFDHTRFVAENASYPHYYSGAHVQGNLLEYGTALVSRVSLDRSSSHAFDRPVGRPGKGFVISTAAWPGSDSVQVDIVSVHFDFLTEKRRRQEAGKLIEVLMNRDNPLVVMGDLNTEYADEGQLIPLLERQLNLRTWKPDEERVVTFPRFNKRLDWVLVSDDIEIISHEVLPDMLSDHRAVVANLRLVTH